MKSKTERMESFGERDQQSIQLPKSSMEKEDIKFICGYFQLCYYGNICSVVNKPIYQHK